jgi:hypothetical protein
MKMEYQSQNSIHPVKYLLNLGTLIFMWVTSMMIPTTNTAQEFLRKDGNWQSITDDLARVTGNIIPSLPTGLGNLPTSEIGPGTNPFAKVYSQNISAGTIEAVDGNFSTLNISRVWGGGR